MIKIVAISIFSVFFSLRVCGQLKDSLKNDSLRNEILNEVVVTATRTNKNINTLAMPILQIDGQAIKNRGIVRLNEILAEQTGLAIVNDHGQGIQMQGFDPAYTLILIDGEPLIGRTTGTLELSRITTKNIDRIEILKGPSSSLYGSEAMAGVINIITKNPKDGLTSSLTTRYGTNNNTDISVEAGYKTNKFFISSFVNRNSSDGYNLRSQPGTNTVSPFSAYTFNGKTNYKLNEKTSLNAAIRYFKDNQRNRLILNNRFVAGNGNVNDYNLSSSILHQFNENLLTTLRLYHSGYKTKSNLNYEDSGSTYDETFFNQLFSRAELQNDYSIADNLKLTGGLGIQYETVEATRYDNLKAFTSGYGYLQADLSIKEKLNIILGGRFDGHSEYQSQFSPKIAANYIFSNKFTLLASVGKGYKAPDFRQLYLNFTNAIAGYSVFGYNEAASRVSQLQNDGLIQTVLIDPSTLQNLNAESSMSFNIGFKAKPLKNMGWSLNLFRNNIENLISAAPIALKTNGQSVFSYFNLNKIYTQGLETDFNYQILKEVSINSGFQFLQAFDQEVIDRIERKEVFTRDAETGLAVVVKRKDYGGLVNRSRYMANAGITYSSTKSGWTTSLRSIYRGRYGLGDSDGNGIINQENEYVRGYTLFNASVSKLVLKDSLRLQFTSDNIFNYKDINFISNLPGRLVYVGITYNFKQ